MNKKKLIAIILAIAIAVSAIGATIALIVVNKSDNGKKPPAETNNGEEKDPKAPWVLKNLAEPDLPTPTYIEKDGDNGLKHTLLQSPFNFDFENMKETVEKNEHIAENYIIGVEHSEDVYGRNYNDIGNQQYYKVRWSIIGIYKDDYEANGVIAPDFTLTLYKDTSKDAGWSRLKLTMLNLDIRDNSSDKYLRDIQQELYTLLKSLVGEEYAEYLIYASGEDYSLNKTIVKSVEGDPESKQTSYTLTRNVKREHGIIEFDISVNSARSNSGKARYYAGGYTSIYEKFVNAGCELPTIFDNHTVGDVNPFNYDTYLNGYINDAVTSPIFDRFSIIEIDNKTVYEFDSTTTIRSNTGTSRDDSDVNISYSITVDNNTGKIVDLTAHVNGGVGSFGSDDMSALTQAAVERINKFIPGLDLTHITVMSDGEYSETKIENITVDDLSVSVRTYLEIRTEENDGTVIKKGFVNIDVDLK